MTREEAIDRLKTEVKRIEEIMENGEAGCVDMDTWNEFAKKAEWRETLIELLSVPTPDPITALRSPTPDPITGLVPCGCGGKAFVWEGRMHSDTYYVQCLFCGVRTVDKVKKADAIREFNTAMGMLEVEG